MSDITNVTGTDAGGDGGFEAGADGNDQILDGAIEGAAVELDDNGEPKPPKKVRPPLSPEEIEKRWGESKAGLKAERRARQDAERRLAALEVKVSSTPAQTRSEAQEDPKPNAQTDPFAYMEWMERRLDAQDAEKRQGQQVQAQTEAERQQVAAISTRMAEHEQDFREDHPDYDDATAHLAQSRFAELRAFGMNEQEARTAVQRDFIGLVATALNKGQDPAQAAYNLAKARGFNGQRQAQTRTGVMDAVQAGQGAARSLSSAGGQGSDNLTVGSVAKLDGAAFDAAFAKLAAKAKSGGF